MQHVLQADFHEFNDVPMCQNGTGKEGYTFCCAGSILPVARLKGVDRISPGFGAFWCELEDLAMFNMAHCTPLEAAVAEEP